MVSERAISTKDRRSHIGLNSILFAIQSVQSSERTTQTTNRSGVFKWMSAVYITLMLKIWKGPDRLKRDGPCNVANVEEWRKDLMMQIT